MKVVIFAGGRGTRLGGEGAPIPKPMTIIGDRPILWHIMKIYSYYGFKEFVILLGYKGDKIREYFANYWLHNSDVCFSLQDNSFTVLNSEADDWSVSLIETGLDTNTGGRLLRAKKVIGEGQFLLTYGDGLADIDIPETVRFHGSHDGRLTMTVVRQRGRFGAVETDDSGRVGYFEEKPLDRQPWINGGFFVCDADIFQYLDNDETVLEEEPLRTLSGRGDVFGFHHQGFWSCLDTPRDRDILADWWDSGKAPWAIWDKKKS